MRILHIITVVFIFLLMSSFVAQAQNTQRDDEIIERLIRLETQMAAMNEKFEIQMTAMNGRIDDLRSLVYVVLGGIMTLICGLLAMMGYVMWDRRTVITPVVKKTKELEQGFEDEKVVLWKVLKGYARVEPRFAEVLKTAGML
ncbi:hypothetical protein AUJ95_09190 [Candidatus Desantisbacteria bacterium CG2_30_40_21]|uniref:Uncharacterized protein n=3 Tax=unclassified Candidatus Desantisiibacteriota TaxID=3106372 RepID=A0A2M7P0Z1_9BACT|nr:MAG: hypothetical protein AUJ95_09190 [Candidatus Desantisbacteria bacterium CG2_30_40_21]PIY18958.1 MAG: hypothetical protein COZ13_07870 [Candidatus Desantisbacteria bacterium CG_4_10_14_3_um_filter_40_18]PJB29433.1 MAG: hypothetical protein CO110_05780 [Candidatus Desantisbacteria bacterium CG_4_9_14_3_um_filter_40_11]